MSQMPVARHNDRLLESVYQLMSFLLAIFVLLVLAAILASVLPKVLRRSPSASPDKLPYKRRDYLLTAAERSLYEVLRSIAVDQLHIFPKVRLADLVYLPKATENRRGYMNRIQAKHVDFVLCDLQNVKPLLVIELDDASHEREDRKQRDTFVDQALAAASLPILHITAKAAYSPKELASLIEEKLQ